MEVAFANGPGRVVFIFCPDCKVPFTGMPGSIGYIDQDILGEYAQFESEGQTVTIVAAQLPNTDAVLTVEHTHPEPGDIQALQKMCKKIIESGVFKD